MDSFARENKHQLHCRVEDASLVLEAEAPDIGANEMRLTEGVGTSGPAISLLINQTYLSDALAPVTTPQVALEMIDNRRPVTIKPVGPLNARHIIMPMMMPAPSGTPPHAETETNATHSSR